MNEKLSMSKFASKADYDAAVKTASGRQTQPELITELMDLADLYANAVAANVDDDAPNMHELEQIEEAARSDLAEALETALAATQGVTAAPQEGACLQDSDKSETQTDLSLTETPQPLAVGVEPEGLPFGIIDPDYARIFTKARILAWSYGFACVPHGSFTRDLDLVLVPWEPNATDEAGARVVAMLAQACDLKLRDDDPFQKPHGRRNWTLMLPGFGEPRWVDLSVLPCVVKEGAPK